MPHTFHFRQFLGEPLPPELRRLFSNLELWRQRGGARPMIILEQGDHNVRYYLEKYLLYRHTISNFGSLVVDGGYTPRPLVPHLNHRRTPSTMPPDHFRGFTYPMVMMLDTQDNVSYANPLSRRANRFTRFYQALWPLTSPMGFFIIHLRIDRSMPMHVLGGSTNMCRMMHLIENLTPPEPPPPRPINHPPDPDRDYADPYLDPYPDSPMMLILIRDHEDQILDPKIITDTRHKRRRP